MTTRPTAHSVDQFTSFGDLLKYLRRRVGLTQRELSIAVGYSDAMICRLEQNQRQPDPATLQARFAPALDLQDEPRLLQRLLELAAAVRREDAPEAGSNRSRCPGPPGWNQHRWKQRERRWRVARAS